MSSKRLPLTTGEFYHVYNKSIADELIFDNLDCLNKILEIVNYYRYYQKIRLSFFNKLSKPIQEDYLEGIKQTQPLVNIYTFSFMPNHFHFLLKQNINSGIKIFLSSIQNSFAKFFNLVNDRNGSLFIKSFKYKIIINEQTFLHVSRYIHLNHVSSFLINFDQLKNHPFSSYSWYLNNNANRFLNTELIFNHFKSKDDFIKFHQNQVEHQRILKTIKDLLLE